MSEYFSADMGAVWIQPDGPNTAPQYLGCHDVGDITAPQGDVTVRFCPDPSGPGKWEAVLRSQGPPGEVTTTVTTYAGTNRDWLQRIVCPAPIYVHQSLCGRKNVFLNYDEGTQLQDGRITSRSKSNAAMREGTDASEMGFDITAKPPMVEYWKWILTRSVTEEAFDLYDIAACEMDVCWGACGPTTEKCDVMYITCGAGTAAPANILESIDGGLTWTAVAGPWAASQNISTIVCFPVSRTVTRIIVGIGTALGTPCEAAYSDDGGDNWTATVIGTTDGEYFMWTGGLWAIDNYHIWGVTSAGNIWFSNDGGASFAEQQPGLTANALYYVHFCDENNGLTVGAANTIAWTNDGGAHWTLATGPAVQGAVVARCCWMLDANRWWVGYDDGEMWYTNDGGVTWAQRTVDTPTGAVSVDSIRDMFWMDHYHGVFVANWTGAATAQRGSLHRTFNGGHDWEVYLIDPVFDADTDPGPASVIMCNYNRAVTVGTLSTTGVIIDASPSP